MSDCKISNPFWIPNLPIQSESRVYRRIIYSVEHQACWEGWTDIICSTHEKAIWYMKWKAKKYNKEHRRMGPKWILKRTGDVWENQSYEKLYIKEVRVH